MAWLRPILLLAGALFIMLLVWWEGRRSRQARAGDLAPAPGAERGPLPETDAIAAPEPGMASQRREQEREVRRSPPVINWSDLVPPAQQSAEDFPATLTSIEPQAPELPLIVDWPEESGRRIVTLRILPDRQDRLAGRALRQGLTASGFRHGPFGIFHLPQPDGRVVLSVASLVRPGMFDPATMDFQKFAGINLFAVLPGPISHDQALQRLAQVTVELAARVNGVVQDENGAPLDASAMAAWRARCLASLEIREQDARPAD
jgi:FtsZ-interacting cell division protein ZipA